MKTLLILLVSINIYGQITPLVRQAELEDSTLAIRAALKDTSYEEDLRFPVSSLRLSGVDTPSVVSYLGTQLLEFTESADAKVYFQILIPHNALNRANTAMYDDSIEIHIHALYSTEMSGDSVKWVFTYTWADIDSEFAAPTTVTEAITASKEDSTHYLETIAYITPTTGKKRGSMILCSLMRDVSEDNFGGSVYLMEIDAHILRREFIKIN